MRRGRPFFPWMGVPVWNAPTLRLPFRIVRASRLDAIEERLAKVEREKMGKPIVLVGNSAPLRVDGRALAETVAREQLRAARRG